MSSPVNPAITAHGQFHASAVSTVKGSKAALSFPFQASNVREAKKFAEKTILDLLPGWSIGTVVLKRKGLRIDAWIFRRGKT